MSSCSALLWAAWHRCSNQKANWTGVRHIVGPPGRGIPLPGAANFRPTLIVAVLVGKLTAGVCGIVVAHLFALRKAEQLERFDRAAWKERMADHVETVDSL